MVEDKHLLQYMHALTITHDTCTHRNNVTLNLGQNSLTFIKKQKARSGKAF